MRFVLALALLAVSPTLALAHTGDSTSLTLLSGFSHPLGGLDHVLAMLAVGVFAAVLGGRAVLLVPLSFIAMMLAGFGLGLAQVSLPYVELGIAVSSLVIGLAATARRPLPVTAAITLVGAFAVLHGQAHGAEMPVGANSLNYALGFVAATTLICCTGLIATAALKRRAGGHGPLLARSIAGLCALLGAGLLAGWL